MKKKIIIFYLRCKFFECMPKLHCTLLSTVLDKILKENQNALVIFLCKGISSLIAEEKKNRINNSNVVSYG